MWPFKAQSVPSPTPAYVERLDHTLQLVSEKYGQNSSRIRQDCLTVLRSHFPALQPEIDILTLNTGEQNSLLCLVGTIPTYFEGRQYNTPVKIWITPNYPRQGPMCFVCPTPDMMIKKNHLHVDLAGMVYLPYLHRWSAECNLTSVVSAMVEVFSRDPPLRATPRGQQSTTNAQQPTPNTTQPSPIQTRTQKSLPSPGIAHQTAMAAGQQFEDPVLVVKRNVIREISSELKKLLETFAQEERKGLDGLLEQQASNKKSSNDTTRTLNYLRSEKEGVMIRTQSMKDKVEEIDKFLSEHSTTEEPDIDDYTLPKDILVAQSMHTAAELSALEDVLYTLEKGLQREVIPLDAFVKLVRRLSRDQFLKKALLTKIQANLRSR